MNSTRGRARSTSPTYPGPDLPPKPSAFEAVATALAVPMEDLAFVGTKTLERAFDELALSAADRAAVEVRILKTKKGGALESHFETETAQKLYPWKVRQEECCRLLADLTGSEAEEADFKAEYLRKAKTGALDVFDVVVGSFLLFAKDEATARRQFLALILRVPPNRRMAVYNWWVADTFPATTVTTHGASIVTLQSPLFPHHPALTQLNERLWSTTIQGGSGQGLYASQDGNLWGGAPNLPVLQGPEGPYVDCAMIQDVTLNLGRALTETQQQLAKLQQQQQRPQQRAPQYREQPQHNNYNYNNNYNRNSYNGNRGNRGRGQGGQYRGRGRVWGGAEEDEPKNE
jgi:hypothetical protein